MNELSEQVNQLLKSTQSYFTDSSHTNPLPYLIAKHSHNVYNLNLAHDPEGDKILEDLAQHYFGDLKKDSAEFGVFDWESDHPEHCILYKRFMADENKFSQNMSSYEECDRKRFLKKQYPLRFFSLELPLNATQSIHLHQYVSGSYQTTWKRKLYWNLFEDVERIKIIDYENGFTIDQDFDFLSFFDRTDSSQCFSVIHSRKWFEKLHGYIERYKKAYREISGLECIDLSVLGDGSEDTWRKCYSLLQYPNLNRCISALNSELLTDEQTISKDVLTDKSIKYEIRAGIPVAIPENVNQLKVIIKMLNDKIVRTQYLKRRGLSDYIDEI